MCHVEYGEYGGGAGNADVETGTSVERHVSLDGCCIPTVPWPAAVAPDNSGCLSDASSSAPGLVRPCCVVNSSAPRRVRLCAGNCGRFLSM